MIYFRTQKFLHIYIMGHFPGDTMVLTDEGAKTIKDLFNICQTQELNIIVNGQKHKCLGMEYCGMTELAKVSLANGMEIYVDQNQEFLDDKGQNVPIKTVCDQNIYIALNHVEDFVWSNSIGTYDEGYIIALMTQCNFYQDIHYHSQVSIDIKVTETNPINNYSYRLLYEFLKDNNHNYEILRHMSTREWVIYRFKSPYLIVLAKKFGISDNHKFPYEKGSYEFNQGYLRGIFDKKGYLHVSKNVSECYILLYDLNTNYLRCIQRLLYNMGVACTVIEKHLYVKTEKHLSQFQFIIGFGMDEKANELCRTIYRYRRNSIDKTDDYYKTHIQQTVINTRIKFETYLLRVEGNIVPINGILAIA
jgi:hypothetical protein